MRNELESFKWLHVRVVYGQQAIMLGVVGMSRFKPTLVDNTDWEGLVLKHLQISFDSFQQRPSPKVASLFTSTLALTHNME